MLSKKRFFQTALLLLPFLTVAIFCAPKLAPEYLSPQYEQLRPATVTLLPVVDCREETVGELNLETQVRRPVKNILEKKGYRVVMADFTTEEGPLSAKNILEMNFDELSQFGTVESDAIVIVYLTKFASHSKLDYCHEFIMEARVSMISKDRQIELWRDQTLRHVGLSGPSLPGPGAEVNPNIQRKNCIERLFASLPAAS